MRLSELARRAKEIVGRIVSRPRLDVRAPWPDRPPVPPGVYYPPPLPPTPPLPPQQHLPPVDEVFYPPPLPQQPPPIPPPRSVADIEALQRLIHDAISGRLGSAVDSLARIANEVRKLRAGGGLSPQQSQILNFIEELLRRWEWPETYVRILGRADLQQWPREYREMRTELEMRRTPGSSNVYSFVWIEDTPRMPYHQIGTTLKPERPTDMGTLIVTFKDWTPGMEGERPDAPGATYAYVMVPRAKWEMFDKATSPQSAGVAVWDYLRVRGTISGHQHNYRLLSVSGEYIPRKATALGFATRMLPGGVEDNVEWRRSTLEAGPLTRFGQPVSSETPLSPSQWRRTMPQVNPGFPNRGSPNRGTPNRGA